MSTQITIDQSVDFSQTGTRIGAGGDASMFGGAGGVDASQMSTKTGRMPAQMEEKERKIDNTQFDPISHKKTLTMINYFILNTAQFLNAFSNVAETKIHAVDERLDELETVISIFESKLDSLPPDAFEWPPEENAAEGEGLEGLGQNPAAALAQTETMQQPQYLAPTENALIAAGANPKAPPPVIKQATGAKGGGNAKNALIMGPAPAPPAVKAPGPAPPLPTSFGKAPPAMPTAAPPSAQPGAAGGEHTDFAVEAAIAQAPLDPEDAKKEELENDPSFAKYLKALKLGVNPAQIRMQIRATNNYNPDDFLLFCDSGQIATLKKIGDYKGDRF